MPEVLQHEELQPRGGLLGLHVHRDAEIGPGTVDDLDLVMRGVRCTFPACIDDVAGQHPVRTQRHPGSPFSVPHPSRRERDVNRPARSRGSLTDTWMASVLGRRHRNATALSPTGTEDEWWTSTRGPARHLLRSPSTHPPVAAARRRTRSRDARPPGLTGYRGRSRQDGAGRDVPGRVDDRIRPEPEHRGDWALSVSGHPGNRPRSLLDSMAVAPDRLSNRRDVTQPSM